MNKTYLGEFSVINNEDFKRRRVSAYRWQDTAATMWNKLGQKPPISSGFMRCFKQNEEKAKNIAYDLSDGNFRDILKLFFWKWSH